MISKIIKALWGDLTKEEYKKFGILAGAMMLIVGNYWMLRVTKDALFNLFVGFEKYQPVIKIITPLLMFAVALGYSKLVDLFKKNTLIYIMCAFYGFTFIILSFLITHPNIVSINDTSKFYPLVSWIPGKGLGWFLYIFLETYGSILIALFYSFIASVMTTDLAKKGYGFLFVFIQIATMVGVLVEMYLVKTQGFSIVYFIGGVLVLIAPIFIKLYLSVFKKELEETKKSELSEKKATGFLEGIKLLLTRPYVIGIFIVASFYEIISTIIEYQMGVSALSTLSHQEFAVFKGYQGLGINVLSFIFVVFGGTSIFMRKFGLKFCLIAFPTTIGLIVLSSYVSFLSGLGNNYMMWIFLWASVAIKGLNYALNKPTSEVLYVPTSKDVRFKSKGWIDSVGLRTTKSLGGAINKISPLFLYGTVVSLGIVGIWIFVATFVGNKFNELQEENKIIE